MRGGDREHGPSMRSTLAIAICFNVIRGVNGDDTSCNTHKVVVAKNGVPVLRLCPKCDAAALKIANMRDEDRIVERGGDGA
jgi:hypothetical protein